MLCTSTGDHYLFYNQLKLLLYMLDSVKEVERADGCSPSTASIASSNSLNLEQLNPKLLNERYLQIASSYFFVNNIFKCNSFYLKNIQRTTRK